MRCSSCGCAQRCRGGTSPHHDTWSRQSRANLKKIMSPFTVLQAPQGWSAPDRWLGACGFECRTETCCQCILFHHSIIGTSTGVLPWISSGSGTFYMVTYLSQGVTQPQ